MWLGIALWFMTAFGQGHNWEIPDRNSQRKAEKELRALYERHYSEQNAEALLSEARKTTDDSVLQYGLLKDARRFGVETCDLKAAFSASRLIVYHYQGAKKGWLTEVLRDTHKRLRTPEQFRQFYGSCMALANQMADEQDFESASLLAREATKIAKVLKSVLLVTRTVDLTAEVRDREKEAELVSKAKKALARDPDDTAASLHLGLYTCFAIGKWEEGLPLIARGEDPTVGKAARAELDQDPKGAADAWERSATQRGFTTLERKRFASRAAHWLQITAKNTSGATRARLNARLDKLEGMAKLTVDLLALVDPQRDGVTGAWTRNAKGITCHMGRDMRIKVPYVPPAEYDLKAVVQKTSGLTVFFGLPAGGTHVVVVLDGTLQGNVTSMPGFSETHAGQIFDDSAPRTVEVAVRRNSITVLVDGAVILGWKAARFIPKPLLSRTVPNHDGIYWGTYQSYYTVSKLEIRLVSGSGKRLQ